jgi:signal transduction histidine kinase
VYRIADGRIVECRNYLGAELADQLSGGDVAPWPGITQLVAEQSALRRVATLVARGPDQIEVFDAVVAETTELFGEDAWLLRFGADDMVTVVALHVAKDVGELTGITLSGDEDVMRRMWSGRPVRVDSFAGRTGTDAELARRLGIAAFAAAPLVVQGATWGALLIISRVGLAVGIEDRLMQFADLAATAIANAQSRAELELFADEQAALRRVAELVAQGAATDQIFDQVTAEASRLLGNAPNALERYERSGAEVVIAAECRLSELAPDDMRYVRGARFAVTGDTGRARVWRTGHATRIDDYEDVAGAETVRAGTRASVSVPIVVEGRLWGVLTAGSLGPPLPSGTEERLTSFCELVAAAIANADSREQLTASRTRIVASGDEARRRLARDVHDGAQQRLVHAIITLKQAQAQAIGTQAAAMVDESLRQAQAANEQLRELAHGIMPAALARGGLRAGVDSLRAHLPLTLEAEVLGERLPEPVESAAYFVVAEALTNVVKHAGADRARVRAVVADDRLYVEVSDDGVGEAEPAGGSGLIGVADRLAAAGGTMSLSSPPGGGTTLCFALPIDR